MEKRKTKTENRKVLVIFNLMLHYNHTTSSLEVTTIHSAQSGLSSLCEALYHLDAVFDVLRRNQRPLMSFFSFFAKGLAMHVVERSVAAAALQAT